MAPFDFAPLTRRYAQGERVLISPSLNRILIKSLFLNWI